MIILRILLNILAILAAAHFVPGITVDSFYTALIVALILGVLNLIIRPIILLLTLPITLLTLGLFALVINALLFWFVASFVEGFQVSGFWAAFFGALIVSIVGSLGSKLTKSKA